MYQTHIDVLFALQCERMWSSESQTFPLLHSDGIDATPWWLSERRHAKPDVHKLILQSVV